MSNKFDIAIIGAGLNGMTAALALKELGLNIALIDKFDVTKMLDEGFDARTSAISFGSKSFFQDLGFWDNIVKDAGEIRDIRILDSDVDKGDSKLKLHFNHADADHNEPMGWIAENRFLRTIFLEALKKDDNIKLFSPAEITEFKNDGNFAELTLNDSETILAKLTILSDGKSSNFAESLGIRKYFSDYKQKAIVFGIKHTLPHGKAATERFMPGGPFAILPMRDEFTSSVVWSDNTELVDVLLKLPAEEFKEQVAIRLGRHLGDFEIITKVQNYPLYLNFAGNHRLNRLVLIGDSAHGLHPIAGQGYNQGVKDTRDLIKLIKKYAELGLDIGSPTLLDEYQKARVSDNLQMAGATHFFNHVFSNNIKTVKLARRIGIAAVDKLPKVKAFFIKKAMGS